MGSDNILCKTDLEPIQILTYKCDIFNDVHFEKSLSFPMYLCGMHMCSFNQYMFHKEVTLF